MKSTPQLTPKRIIMAVTGVAVFLFLAVNIGRIFEDVGPDDIVVIQHPIDGTLTWHITPGMKWQGLGTVTTYKKRRIYNFDTVVSDSDGRVNNGTGGIGIRFNDGGHGTVYGSIQYDLPVAQDKLNAIHAKYRTREALHQDLIVRITQNAIYLSGPLMSSRESYNEKRSALIFYVLDQVQNGVYRTRTVTKTIRDPITEKEKQIEVSEIVMGADGKPERQERSILSDFGVHAFNFTIRAIDYDKVVEDQIKQQQVITMDVQTAIAEAKKAEQRAITVEQQGKANAAQARWEQEVIKAREVTKAEQEKQVAETQAQRDKNVAETQALARKNVADLDAKTAALRKTEQILLGEGESARKKMVIEADGALAQKLEALVQINRHYAAAIRDYRGDWVPRVVMGQNGSTQQANGAQILIDLLVAKTAKELAVDLSVQRGRKETK